MKPFYGIDNTIDDKNEKENGDEFLVQKPDENLYKEYDRAVNGVLANITKSLRLPRVLKVIEYLIALPGSMLLCALVQYFLSEEYAGFHPIVGQMILVVLICAGVVIPLHFIIKNIEKKEDESEEKHLQSKKAETLYLRLLSDLGVPAGASEIDVLSFNYKVKKGTIEIDKCGMSVPMFYNMHFYIYRDEENLYFAADSGKYAFKLPSIKTLHKIEHKNTLFFWNKDIPHNQGEYKKYKIKEDEMGNYRCRAYCILEIENDGESYGIYLPEYEEETLKRIIGNIC